MKGFTIIELMVVITIIIILSGMSFAAYFTFSQKQAALNDARNMETVLRRVQSLAKNRVYPVGCASGLTGYRVFTNCGVYGESCQTVSAGAVCAGVEMPTIVGEQVLAEAFFSDEINILFNAGSGSVNTPITLPIGNIGGLAVTVDQNGDINSD